MKHLYKIIGFSLLLLFSFACSAMEESPIPGEYTVKIGNFSKTYPVVSPKGNSHVSIVYIPDFRDNVHLAQSASKAIVNQLQEKGLLTSVEGIVVPGDKANMLGGILWKTIIDTLSKRKGDELFENAIDIDLCILSSSEKGEIIDAIPYGSISGGDKKLPIRKDQASKIQGKNILIVDDVISTGGTLRATKILVEKYGGKPIAFACIATEGNSLTDFEGKPLIFVAHLPIFIHKKES